MNTYGLSPNTPSIYFYSSFSAYKLYLFQLYIPTQSKMSHFALTSLSPTASPHHPKSCSRAVIFGWLLHTKKFNLRSLSSSKLTLYFLRPSNFDVDYLFFLIKYSK